MNKIIFCAIFTILLVSVSITFSYAELQIPEWLKNNVKWWADGQIDDSAFIAGIEYLISEKIIDVPITQKTVSATDKIPSWVKNNAEWWADGIITDSDFVVGIEFLVNSGIIQIKQTTQSQIDSTPLEIDEEPNEDDIKTQNKLCSGIARCFTGKVTSVIDGDTIKVDGQSIRFALVDAPKLKYDGGKARNFVELICPVGSAVVVDQDDKQLEDKYGRILGVIYCNNLNLNKELLDSSLGDLYSAFCDQSEFSTQPWALKHGCTNSENETTDKQTQNCDPSYPDFCIPPPPPDLDCVDISQKDFTVLQPDPHRFDEDKDGIGCES